MPLASAPGAMRERALAKLLPQNGVLAALPEDVLTRLLPHLALADLPAGHQLGEPGGRFARAFFPLAGVVSLRDGDDRTVALVGSEGVVGLPRFMSDAALARPVVQFAGYGLALGRDQLLEEWALGGGFMRVVMRFGRALAAQTVALAACHAERSVRAQLCFMLAMSLERLPNQDLVLSSDAAARWVGADPREVAAALDWLREAGALTWRGPGVFSVQQHQALHAMSSACANELAGEHRRPLPVAAATISAVPAHLPPADDSPRRRRREVFVASAGAERAANDRPERPRS